MTDDAAYQRRHALIKRLEADARDEAKRAFLFVKNPKAAEMAQRIRAYAEAFRTGALKPRPREHEMAMRIMKYADRALVLRRLLAAAHPKR
jgi:hypothetical protein